MEEVTQHVEKQSNEIKVLENLVTVTEDRNVESLDEEVKVNTEDTEQPEEVVADHEERPIEIKETVDETVDKVDELNHMVYVGQSQLIKH